jgi:hypothetical protein
MGNAAVDRKKCMKMKNGADQTGAIFLPKIRLEKGFFTASTFEITGLRGFLRRSGGMIC